MRPGAVVVTLLEGRVAVSVPHPGTPATGGSILAPGDRLEIAGDGAQSLSRVDPAAARQWQSGMVQFDNVTLAEAVAELNRYSETKTQVPDAGLAAERLSGTFPTGRPEEFASSLALFLPVTAERSGQKITLVARKPQCPDAPGGAESAASAALPAAPGSIAGQHVGKTRFIHS